MQRIAAIAVCLALGAAPIARADEPCKLMRQSAFELRGDTNGVVYAPVTIQRHPTYLVVQTGDAVSALTTKFVADLNLPSKSVQPGNIITTGGQSVYHFVTADPVEIGKIPPGSMDFLVTGTNGLSDMAAGGLGNEFLHNFDVEIDFAALKMNLFRHNNCAEGAVVYWTDAPYGEAQLLPGQTGISFNVTLDGQTIPAEIHTGATKSYMAEEDAQSLFDLDGKTDTTPPNPAKAVDQKHPFKSLDFGGVAVSNPNIELVPRAQTAIFSSGRGPRLIIGASVLRHLHIYIAYGDRRFYATAADAH